MEKFKFERKVTMTVYLEDEIEVEAESMAEAVRKVKESNSDRDKVWHSMYTDAIAIDARSIDSVVLDNENGNYHKEIVL